MTKQEFIQKVAQKSGLSRDAAKAVDAFLEAVTDALKARDSQLHGLREVLGAGARGPQGVNPRTGERVEIAATTVPKFTAGSQLKAGRPRLAPSAPSRLRRGPRIAALAGPRSAVAGEHDRPIAVDAAVANASRLRATGSPRRSSASAASSSSGSTRGPTCSRRAARRRHSAARDADVPLLLRDRRRGRAVRGRGQAAARVLRGARRGRACARSRRSAPTRAPPGCS